mgnify:CR=1 FL=1
MRNNRAIFDIDSAGKAVNLARLSGINFVDRTDIEATEKSPAGDWVVGFGLTGYREYFLDGAISPKKKEDIMKTVTDGINPKRALPLPSGGRVCVDIVSEIFISSKTENLVIASIAPRTALFIAEKGKFKDLDSLLTDLSQALVDVSNNKKTDFSWENYEI